MDVRNLPLILLLAVAMGTSVVTSARAQSLPEELRFQGELQACAANPEPIRADCERLVRAKIVAAWKARIEIEAMRRVGK